MRARGYEITFCWGARTTSRQKCAEASFDYGQRVRALVTAPITWEVATSLEGGHVLCDGAEAIARALAAGQQQYEVAGLLGTFYQASLVNLEDRGMTCALTLGVDVRLDPIWVCSSVVLRLPWNCFGRSDPTSGLVELLGAGARAFRPLWGFVATIERAAVSPSRSLLDSGAATIGWLTYLSDELGAVPTLDSPASSVRRDFGAVVIACSPPWSASRAAREAPLARVREQLDAAGLIRPDTKSGARATET